MELEPKKKGVYQPLVRLHLSVTEGLQTEIDRVAKRLFNTRSDYIRHAIIQQLEVDSLPGPNPRKTSKHLPQRMIIDRGGGGFGIKPEWSATE